MIRIVRDDEILIEDGYNRIAINASAAYLNGNPMECLEPVYANLVPSDHPAKTNASRLAQEWEELNT